MEKKGRDRNKLRVKIDYTQYATKVYIIIIISSRSLIGFFFHVKIVRYKIISYLKSNRRQHNDIITCHLLDGKQTHTNVDARKK